MNRQTERQTGGLTDGWTRDDGWTSKRTEGSLRERQREGKRDYAVPAHLGPLCPGKSSE